MHHQHPSLSAAAYANRVRQLAAAFAAFRRAHNPGRRIPLGLRKQVVAALNAGVSTVCRADTDEPHPGHAAVVAGASLGRARNRALRAA